ncbi:hypothetical protein [Pseudidiomarina aquimaris]|nr:hypothetical protein [Pseudidiomarina aquimaris]
MINNTSVFALEVCKLSQYAALQIAELKVPRTGMGALADYLIECAKK